MRWTSPGSDFRPEVVHPQCSEGGRDLLVQMDDNAEGPRSETRRRAG